MIGVWIPESGRALLWASSSQSSIDQWVSDTHQANIRKNRCFENSRNPTPKESWEVTTYTQEGVEMEYFLIHIEDNVQCLEAEARYIQP